MRIASFTCEGWSHVEAGFDMLNAAPTFLLSLHYCVVLFTRTAMRERNDTVEWCVTAESLVFQTHSDLRVSPLVKSYNPCANTHVYLPLHYFLHQLP